MNLRKLALDLLDKNEKSGQYSNIAVDNAISREGLDGKDSRLLSALVYGVIERRITLDFIIDGLSSLPPSRSNAPREIFSAWACISSFSLIASPPTPP